MDGREMMNSNDYVGIWRADFITPDLSNCVILHSY